jgi:hypothetical protein
MMLRLKSIHYDVRAIKRRPMTRDFNETREMNAWSGVIFTVYLTLSVRAHFSRSDGAATASVKREK